jgi:hypothetical protein
MGTNELSQEVLQHLAKAPALVFLLVAAADGNVDKKEIRQFQEILQDPAYQPLFAAMQESKSSVLELLAAIQSSERSPIDELAILRGILESLIPEDAATLYKVMLLKLAKSIAEASGGFLGVFGSKISKEEKFAIAAIANALGLLGDHGDTKQVAPALSGGNSAQPRYSSVLELPENLFPALKPAEWAKSAKEQAVLNSIFPEGTGKDNDPVVAYAIDDPTSVRFVNKVDLASSLTVDDIHQYALANLENRLEKACEWQVYKADSGNDEIGVVEGLVFKGDYFASESMLSEKILRQAHEKLDTALLMVIAPFRGELYASHLISDTDIEMDRALFASLAIKRHFYPDQAPISPNAWISRNGKIAGHVAGMEGIIEVAKKYTEAKLVAEGAKLEHNATTFEAHNGVGVNLHVIAHDVEVMLKNLQDVMRGCANDYAELENFTGSINVNIELKDSRVEPSMKDGLSAEMDRMFAFLNDQFSTIKSDRLNGLSILLKYNWV